MAARERVRGATAALRRRLGPRRPAVDLPPGSPVSRYGYDRPPHPGLYRMLDSRRDAFRGLLEGFADHREDLLAIPQWNPPDPDDPYWTNGWFQGLDAVALYCLLAQTKPDRYIEVGSGHSTRFARRAIKDHALGTHVTSIDPEPRVEVDRLCDRVLRRGLEDVELSLFDELAAGDLVFLDGSHRCLQNSDVTTFFLDVLPRLPGGVLVHLHDIFLPWDYPPQMSERLYSEQYLLATWLLTSNDPSAIVLPCFFITIEPELHHLVDWLWDGFAWSATATNGLSFWLRTPGGPGH